MPSPTLRYASTAPPGSQVNESVSKPPPLTHRYLVFLLIASLGCAADLLTKYWIFHWRGMPSPNGHTSVWWIWQDYVGIQTATNTGALFGLGAGLTWLFALLSVFAAGGVFFWVFRAGAIREWLLTIALAAILAGILGNLYDRLGLWAVPGESGVRDFAVRDWILFRFRSYTWPNFNIADSLLVVGAIMLGWHGFRSGASSSESDSVE